MFAKISKNITLAPEIAIVYVASLLLLSYMIWQPLEMHLARALIDDSFYYLGYARNIALGNGPTFDGLIYTNGVQPLWALMLVGIAFISPDPQDLIYSMMIVSVLLFVGGSLLLDFALRTLLSRYERLLFAVLLLAWILEPSVAISGMEMPITFFTLALALAAVLRITSISPFSIATAGLCVALTVLSRIDLLILTPSFALMLLWRIRSLPDYDANANVARRIISPVLWLAIPSIVLFGLYLLINQVTFDVWLPISAEVKTQLHAKFLERQGGYLSLQHFGKAAYKLIESLVRLFSGWLKVDMVRSGLITESQGIIFILFSLAMLACILALWTYRVMLNVRKMRFWEWTLQPSTVLWLIVVNVALHIGIMNLQLADSNMWYYVPEQLIMIFTITLLIGRIARLAQASIRGPAFQCVMAISITVVGLVLITGVQNYYKWVNPLHPLIVFHDAALWITSNIPEGQLVGSWDSGVIGYFTPKHTIINLDGLMNDHELLTLKVAGPKGYLDQYIRSKDIHWLANFVDAGKDLRYRSGWSGCLETVYSKPYSHWGRIAEMQVARLGYKSSDDSNSSCR